VTKWLVILLLSCSISIHGQPGLLDSINRSISSLQGIDKYQRLYELAEENTDLSLADALELSLAALQQARSLRQDSLLFRSLMQLGDIYLQIPQFKKSDSIYHLAIQMADQMHDQKKKMVAVFGLASCNSQQGNWAESFRLLDQNISLAAELKDSAVLARALMRKGTEMEKSW
jgi:tetratricopeptide (TPR) repeat protein